MAAAKLRAITATLVIFALIHGCVSGAAPASLPAIKSDLQ
jgi:hypothetical protein